MMRRRRRRIPLKKRAVPAPQPAAPPPPAPPGETELACICGQLLKLTPTLAGKRVGCPRCRRKFVVSFSRDARTSQQIPVPIYFVEPGRTGETHIAPVVRPPAPPDVTIASPPERAAEVMPTESDAGISDIKDESEIDLVHDLIPDPPRALYFVCPCGQKLLAKKEMYDRRVRCPYCRQRLLITLTYDDVLRQYDIQPVRLTDAPTGDTDLLGDSR